jgi:hypothetical protein
VELSKADLIWNRAALEAGGPHPRDGDQALAKLLRAHGMICNGGVDHALESLSAQEIREAKEGFRYFGLSKAGDLMEDAFALRDLNDPSAEAAIDALNKRYWSVVPSDQTLVVCFEVRFHDAPDDFARAE